MRLLLPFVTLALDTSPVAKVLELLRDLRDKIEEEAKEETKTYNRFERFCKEEIAVKQEEIANGEARQASIEAELQTLESRLADARDRAATAKKNLEDLANALMAEQRRRKEEHEKYVKNELDLSEAITAVRNAVQSLSASRSIQENAGGGTGNNFLQTLNMRETIMKATLIADALGLEVKTKKVLSFLEKARPDNNREDYAFHSDEISSVLKKLQQDLVTEKATLDKTESENDHKSNMTKQQNKEDRQREERALQKEQALISKLVGDIGQANQDLMETKEKLGDDRSYLSNLEQNYDEKQRTWNQRVQMREDEINALSEATDIIADQVSANATDATVRLIQEHVQVKSTHPSSFIQVKKQLLEPDNSTRDRILEILRNVSTKHKSAMLTALTTEVQKDHFKKIRGMIQAMIEKLQEEAQNEQDHENFCKKQTALATQQRDIRAEEIRTLNQSMEEGEARRDQLEETRKVLSDEIESLKKAFDEASEERRKEKAEHEKAVADAENASGATKQAEAVLRRFYEEKGAKGKVQLVHQKSKTTDYPEAPDAGFKNFEAYKGSQGASKGILGMIDVIQSDFQRTIDATKAAEHEAVLAFEKMFEGENMASQDEKKKLRSTTEDNLTETRAQLSQEMDSLVEAQRLIDRVIAELGDLYKACVETEMSYEERVARREDEIKSLKEALCILDNEGPVKTGYC